MHTYLRAIGFGNILTNMEINGLVDDIIKDPDFVQRVVVTDKEQMIEIQKNFGEGFGIIIHGTLDENDKVDVEYYFPYLIAKKEQEVQDVLIEKHVSNMSFAGACDDIRVGVSLVFYLQNGIDYILSLGKERTARLKKPIKYSALSISGTVLFPIEKTELQRKNAKINLRERTNLIEKAREGDAEAIESLTLDELDTVSKIYRRIQSEDVFSIVESTFMPFGMECDLYNVIGEIQEIKLKENEYTNEEIYILTIDCNGLEFEVAINKQDLLGEPKVGRRFKGPIWMQGRVDFEYEN